MTPTIAYRNKNRRAAPVRFCHERLARPGQPDRYLRLSEAHRLTRDEAWCDLFVGDHRIQAYQALAVEQSPEACAVRCRGELLQQLRIAAHRCAWCREQRQLFFIEHAARQVCN